MPPQLFPHQADAVADITAGPLPHRYLADEQGLGKTATALTALMVWEVTLGLVICPASAVPVWVREANTWWPGVKVFTPRQPDELVRVNRETGPCLVIINYDLLSRGGHDWLTALRSHSWGAVICDEAHRLKNPEAKRTQVVFGNKCDGVGGLIEGVAHVLLQSGTPITRYNMDLWAPMRALWPERLFLSGAFPVPMTQLQFREKFCLVVDNGFGPQVKGNQCTHELARRLAGKPGFGRVVIRRTKAEVAKDLPELRLVLTPIDLPVPVEMERDMPEGLSGDDLANWIDARVVRQSTTRRLMGEYKLSASIDWILDWLDDNPEDKLIVFAVHRAVLTAIYVDIIGHGIGAVQIDGETPLRLRDTRVQQFQTDLNCRCFVGQLATAGEAITLHAASTVVFVETDWNSTAIAQGLARAHRIGQRRAVLGHILIIPGSWDEKIHAIAARKAAGISALWAGEREHAETTTR